MASVLNDKTIAIVKATAPALRDRGLDVTRRMYEHLFVNPDIRALFNQSHHGEDGSQPKALAGASDAQTFVLVSLITGVLVAVSGPIGFVGLILPHAVRLVVGSDHRRALPAAALAGAAFLVLADIVARTMASPQEIPVGVLTALCGGPFFLWLIRRDARRGAAAQL